jgi:hypothetical protein
MRIANYAEFLNEGGSYDTLVRKVQNDILQHWKKNVEKRKNGHFEKEYSLTDKKGRELEFILLADLDLKKSEDQKYTVDGASDAGNVKKEDIGYLVVKFEVDPSQLPGMWETIYHDIGDVVRHEIEHLTQGGWNLRPGKKMKDDIGTRALIHSNLLPKKNYFLLDMEVDAMLLGMHYKAKKTRTPFKDVIEDYLSDKQQLSPEDKAEVLKKWTLRAKQLSLPPVE